MTEPAGIRMLNSIGISIDHKNDITVRLDNVNYIGSPTNNLYMCPYCSMKCREWERIDLCKGSHFFYKKQPVR